MKDKRDKQCCCNIEPRHKSCAACSGENIFSYWCKTCNRSVPEGRCPYCGLKAQKKKGEIRELSDKM
jgi:hypothetical protein